MRGRSGWWGVMLALLMGFAVAHRVVEGAYVDVCEGCTYEDICTGIMALSPNDEVRLLDASYLVSNSCTVNINVTLNMWGGATLTVSLTPAFLIDEQTFIITNGTLSVIGAIAMVGQGATVSQISGLNLIIDSVSPDYAGIVNMGTWNQYGNLNINRSVGEDPVRGFKLGPNATWNQFGHTSFQLVGDATAVVWEDQSQWNQVGSLLIYSKVSSGLYEGNYNSWRWTSTGQVTLISPEGFPASFSIYGTWIQNSSFTSVNGSIRMEDGAVWKQYGSVMANCSSPVVVFGSGRSEWYQHGSVALTVTSNSGIVAGMSGRGTWWQYGPLSFVLSDAYGVVCTIVTRNRLPVLTWYSLRPYQVTPPNSQAVSGDCLPAPFPSASPMYLVSNNTLPHGRGGSNVINPPSLRVNLTTNEVVLTPRDSEGREHTSLAMGLAMGAISSTSAGSTPYTPSVTDGAWSEVTNNSLGASEAFQYTCTLLFPPTNSSSGGGGSLSLQYFLFSDPADIEVGENVSFSIAPAFTKFTLDLAEWYWQWRDTEDPDERAEVRLAITPTFTSFVELERPAPFVREFLLQGAGISKTYDGGTASTRLLLIEAATFDDQFEAFENTTWVDDGVEASRRLMFKLDTSSSELVMSFGRFNSTLSYDPAVGVLLTGNKQGSSSDNTGLIVGVAVALPLAALLVIAVVAGAITVTWWRSKHRPTLQAINFQIDDQSPL